MHEIGELPGDRCSRAAGSIHSSWLESSFWNGRLRIDYVICDSPESVPIRTRAASSENEGWLSMTEGKSVSVGAPVKKCGTIPSCRSAGASHYSTYSDTNSPFSWLFRVGLCSTRIAGVKIRRALGFAISVGRHSVRPAASVPPKMPLTPNSVHSAENRWSL